jgi:hypothetical protein
MAVAVIALENSEDGLQTVKARKVPTRNTAPARAN